MWRLFGFLFCRNELLFGIILVGGTGGQMQLAPALLAIGPLTASGASPMVFFAAASTLSITPPLALIFQRFITRLNIVDPNTTRDT